MKTVLQWEEEKATEEVKQEDAKGEEEEGQVSSAPSTSTSTPSSSSLSVRGGARAADIEASSARGRLSGRRRDPSGVHYEWGDHFFFKHKLHFFFLLLLCVWD